MPKYTKELGATLSVGNTELDLTLRVNFYCHPGRPSTPPAYDHGGLPPDPPEVEVHDIFIMPKKTPLPPELESALSDSSEFLHQLGELCEWGRER